MSFQKTKCLTRTSVIIVSHLLSAVSHSSDSLCSCWGWKYGSGNSKSRSIWIVTTRTITYYAKYRRNIVNGSRCGHCTKQWCLTSVRKCGLYTSINKHKDITPHSIFKRTFARTHACYTYKPTPSKTPPQQAHTYAHTSTHELTSTHIWIHVVHIHTRARTHAHTHARARYV